MMRRSYLTIELLRLNKYGFYHSIILPILLLLALIQSRIYRMIEWLLAN